MVIPPAVPLKFRNAAAPVPPTMIVPEDPASAVWPTPIPLPVIDTVPPLRISSTPWPPLPTDMPSCEENCEPGPLTRTVPLAPAVWPIPMPPVVTSVPAGLPFRYVSVAPIATVPPFSTDSVPVPRLPTLIPPPTPLSARFQNPPVSIVT